MVNLIAKLNRYLAYEKPLTRSCFILSAMVASIALGGCQVLVVESDKMVTADMVVSAMAPPEPTPPPTPLPGSAEISFMDATTAALDGCRMLTRVTIRHIGDFDGGMIRLRNTATQINANMIIPVRIIEAENVKGESHFYSVKMMRCPQASDV